MCNKNLRFVILDIKASEKKLNKQAQKKQKEILKKTITEHQLNKETITIYLSSFSSPPRGRLPMGEFFLDKTSST